MHALDQVFVNFASYRNQLVRKVAFRYSEATFLEYGNHYCNNAIKVVVEVISGAEFGIFLKHYPMRSFHQLKSKIINGGKSISAVDKSSIGAHWRQDYDRYMREGDDFVWKKINDYCAATQDFSIEY